MAWLDNGITNERFVLDQSAVVSWGNTATRIPFHALSNVGLLRGLYLRTPVTTTNLNTAAGPASHAPQAGAQQPLARAVQTLSIIAQGIAPLYQLGKGTMDVMFLEYVRNGQSVTDGPALNLYPDTNPPATNQFGGSGASTAFIQGNVASGTNTATAGAAGVQPATIGFANYLPLTEYVKFPPTVVTDPKTNKPTPVAAHEGEVGLIMMQNAAQNVQFSALLNPLYSTTVDSPLLASSSTGVTGTVNATFELRDDFYDVPDAANMPPAYTMFYAITRTTFDDAVTGGSVTHVFQNAGMLLRAIHCFYDVNDNLVDVSTQGAGEGTVTFQWGSSVLKVASERFSDNLLRAFKLYGALPPIGALFLDFFQNHSVTDMVNTGRLANVRTTITGLPGSVVTMHTIEERMIPVRNT